MVEGESEMAAMVTNYFDEMSTSNAGHCMDELLERVI
jgi:hypothetical protein